MKQKAISTIIETFDGKLFAITSYDNVKTKNALFRRKETFGLSSVYVNYEILKINAGAFRAKRFYFFEGKHKVRIDAKFDNFIDFAQSVENPEHRNIFATLFLELTQKYFHKLTVTQESKVIFELMLFDEKDLQKILGFSKEEVRLIHLIYKLFYYIPTTRGLAQEHADQATQCNTNAEKMILNDILLLKEPNNAKILKEQALLAQEHLDEFFIRRVYFADSFHKKYIDTLKKALKKATKRGSSAQKEYLDKLCKRFLYPKELAYLLSKDVILKQPILLFEFENLGNGKFKHVKKFEDLDTDSVNFGKLQEQIALSFRAWHTKNKTDTVMAFIKEYLSQGYKRRDIIDLVEEIVEEYQAIKSEEGKRLAVQDILLRYEILPKTLEIFSRKEDLEKDKNFNKQYSEAEFFMKLYGR